MLPYKPRRWDLGYVQSQVEPASVQRQGLPPTLAQICNTSICKDYDQATIQGEQLPHTTIMQEAHTTQRAHFHIGLATNQQHDVKAYVSKMWKAHFPAKRICKFDGHCVNVKLLDTPKLKGLLWYALFGTKRRPRKKAPWYGCPLRTPVK